MQIKGDYLFVAAGYDGLAVFDLTNELLSAPSLLELGTEDFPVYALGLSLSENMLFLTAYDSYELLGIDISNPQGPEIISSHTFEQVTKDGFKSGFPLYVSVFDKYAYVSTQNYSLEIIQVLK